ncbi:hypothetical protein [Phyllobacterium sp. OV277]|uniref:hypothetical protein n=1 Tax=Phyllobacterium sp. OV277 TaxID=1882772 RepID=UPI001113CBC2|nr:hypothetical protein [Phyllobacterium sp. OV277]
MTKSVEPLVDYAEIECTVYFWDTDIPSETFAGFEAAIDYVKKHLSAAHHADIHVHTAQLPEPTYIGEELSPFLIHG